MPNWSYNRIAIKGSDSDLLEFFNVAFKNSEIEEQTDLNTAIDKLSNCYSIDYSTNHTGVMDFYKRESLHLGTWYPMPEIFKYDTTNHADDFPEICQKQLDKYGAIGWYDYNYKRFGCKWDCSLDFDGYEEIDEDNTCVWFNCETPWCIPDKWLNNICKDFPNLKVYILANEESNAYNIVADISSDKWFEFTLDYSDDEEHYIDAEDRLSEEMNECFDNLIYS